MTISKTVLLKGEAMYKEAVAGGTITPGMLIMRNSSNAVVVHNAAGGRAQAMFAFEDELQGKTISDNYVSGDNVVFVVPERGAEINAVVAANAAAIVIGDFLESDGAGGVRKYTALTDNTGGSADATLQSIGGTYTQAEVRNDFADLAARANLAKSGAIAIALEAVDNSAVSAIARLKIEVL